MKKQIDFPVSIYQAQLKLSWDFFIKISEKPKSISLRPLNSDKLDNSWIRPIFVNSIRKICLKEADCSSTLVCFLVYAPSVLKMSEITALIKTALVATTNNTTVFVIYSI